MLPQLSLATATTYLSESLADANGKFWKSRRIAIKVDFSIQENKDLGQAHFHLFHASEGIVSPKSQCQRHRLDIAFVDFFGWLGQFMQIKNVQ
jgi:hypothetical protein